MTNTNANVRQSSAPCLKTSSTTQRSARRRSDTKVSTSVVAVQSSTGKITKRDQPAALVVRDEGATLEQMIATTGWLPHTTRAALTGLRKAGYVLDSDKIDGVRTYRAVAPQ